jgi:hypothetical protein
MIERTRSFLPGELPMLSESERARRLEIILTGLEEDRARRERAQTSKQRALKALGESDAVKLARRRASIQRARKILEG